jgi:hypothetical protein
MKKIISISAFLLITCILFTACTKDEAITEETILDPTEQKILDFKAKLESPEKSNETMTVEEAVWNIEAALNYSYNDLNANAFISYNLIRIPIQLSDNGEIEFDEITSTYFELESLLTGFIGENSLSLADIEFIENKNKSDEGELKMTTIVKGSIPNLQDFGSTDYWKAIWEEGKCGEYTGQEVGKDAATQLMYKANLTRSAPIDGYITDIETIYDFCGLYPWDEDYLFHAYGSGNTIQNSCIEPNEMNYWLNQLKQLANNNAPLNKEIVGYFVTGNWFAVPDEGWGIGHYADISYGTFHSGSPQH